MQGHGRDSMPGGDAGWGCARLASGRRERAVIVDVPAIRDARRPVDADARDVLADRRARQPGSSRATPIPTAPASVRSGRAGRPHRDKQPLAAWQDPPSRPRLTDLVGTTFLAHVRYASTGGIRRQHASLPHGRAALRAQRRCPGAPESRRPAGGELDVPAWCRCQTDSERVFALVTAEIRAAGGDVAPGGRVRRSVGRGAPAPLRPQRRPGHEPTACGRCAIRRPTSSGSWSDRPEGRRPGRTRPWRRAAGGSMPGPSTWPPTRP